MASRTVKNNPTGKSSAPVQVKKAKPKKAKGQFKAGKDL